VWVCCKLRNIQYSAVWLGNWRDPVKEIFDGYGDVKVLLIYLPIYRLFIVFTINVELLTLFSASFSV